MKENHVKLTEEVVNLARRYIAEGAIGEGGKLVDAEHIAIATINHNSVNFK